MKATYWIFGGLVLASAAGLAFASTQDAWSDLDQAVRDACVAQSDLKDAHIEGGLTDFEGHVVATVKGTWKPAHMKGASATFLCLYDKRAKSAQTSEVGQFP